MAKLVLREIRRRAAAEINEVRLAATDEFFSGVDFQFGEQRVEVAAHSGGILVRIDLEVAEMAALPTEWNVDVEAEGSRASSVESRGQAAQRRQKLRHEFRFPKRERRIVRDEIIAHRRFLLNRRGRRLLKR